MLIAAVHKFVARSQAALAMINLDDLGEEETQLNMPGTVEEYPNWRRRIARTVESLLDDPEAAAQIRDVVGERT